ncbi:unnamed protein product, partial [marine sediment metagenome]
YGVGGADGSCKKVYEIDSPYTSAQAYEFHYAQSADVLYMAHEDFAP